MHVLQVHYPARAQAELEHDVDCYIAEIVDVGSISTSEFPASMQEVFFHADDQQCRKTHRENLHPRMGVNRCGLKQLVHQRHIGQGQLQNSHRRHAVPDRRIAEEANFQRRATQGTAVEQIEGLDHDENVDRVCPRASSSRKRPKEPPSNNTPTSTIRAINA